MVHVVCPKCQNRDMTQDKANPRNFTCSKCGKFVLLPMNPDGKDVSMVWDYLIQAGRHFKEMQRAQT